jgi:hypothetical protein
MIFGDGNDESTGGTMGPIARFVEDDWARAETEFWWSKTDISQLT